MSTGLTWRTVSTSLSETLNLAAALGRKLQGGEVIELVSDLGGGKTTFVKGMAKGIGSRDHVHSPSFTLANEYQGGKLRLYHLDLYRLEEPGLMQEEIAEYLGRPEGVVVVEWPGLVENILPSDTISINIKPLGETEREFIFSYPRKFARLFPTNT